MRREGSREQVIDLEKEDWSREAGETWLSSSLGPLAEKNLTFSAGGRAKEFLWKIWGRRSSGTVIQVLEPKAARGSWVGGLRSG